MLITFSIFHLVQQNLAMASASFAMAFVSFIWANISRFKRFKGLGIEAELWEDKKKEANLISTSYKPFKDWLLKNY